MSDLKESLKRSSKNRELMIKHFGFIPLSILKISRGKLSKNVFTYQNDRGIKTSKGDRALKIGGIYNSNRLKISGGGSRQREAFSIMPAELVDFFIKYYAKKGNVYLDPFMGQGIQLQVAKMRGLDYYGYDISEEFFAYIESVKLKIDDNKTTIKIFCKDSKNPDNIPDGIGDFCFTSPPYWDIEFYGEEKNQLGYKSTYDDFLEGMYQVAKNWLPKFKVGAYCVVNVNDFRKDGRFYPYHSDTISLFTRAGWIITDTWIIEGLVGGLPKAFGVDFNLKRIAPKLHEYALVFRKFDVISKNN